MHHDGTDVLGTEVETSANEESQSRSRNRKRRWHERMPERLHMGALRCIGGKEAQGEIRIPAMRLRGFWLYLLGFRANTWFTVAFDGKSLILTPEAPQPTPKHPAEPA